MEILEITGFTGFILASLVCKLLGVTVFCFYISCHFVHSSKLLGSAGTYRQDSFSFVGKIERSGDRNFLMTALNTHIYFHFVSEKQGLLRNSTWQ